MTMNEMRARIKKNYYRGRGTNTEQRHDTTKLRRTIRKRKRKQKSKSNAKQNNASKVRISRAEKRSEEEEDEQQENR